MNRGRAVGYFGCLCFSSPPLVAPPPFIKETINSSTSLRVCILSQRLHKMTNNLSQLLSGNSIVISTGNILNIDKKPGRKSTEELTDGLKLTFKDPEATANLAAGELHRNITELQSKLSEHERPNISIGAKIFLNKKSTENLNKAMTSLLSILKVDCVDNVVLAYHPKPSKVVEGDTSYGILKWGSKDKESTEELKDLWTHLEQFALDKKICQLGVSDLDTDTLTELYTGSKVHPLIAQINLASCCVVPPPLQEFCTKNDIQLLTHSDPEIILNDSAWSELNLADLSLDWVVRYQVHLRCRGVLTAKGYIVGASK
ncbi:glutamate--cysteine ligase regulatory subunit isoform X2 [Eupeodes corollae]|uniref:glutamate--cysteine ligase regulatory subunit isoform X2 n=1 Tax=Eupeodes corollae TaxID=290404 RepID=UPI00248FDE79|nr:glutamate--cysteine ligase regulatory subunit isoform X2 [Eupeodes corollae]